MSFAVHVFRDSCIQKRHQNFFDFSEFYPNDKKVQPIYFSFVRHPVERIISWYYYVRSSEYQIDHESIKTKMPIGLLKVRNLMDLVFNNYFFWSACMANHCEIIKIGKGWFYELSCSILAKKVITFLGANWRVYKKTKARMRLC